MIQLMPYLFCLSQLFSKPMLDQLTLICDAMLCSHGRITMLGLSRWSLENPSVYRRIKRFYSKPINWLLVHGTLFFHHRFNPKEVYLLVGDETTVSKSGKHTFGLGKFFSSIHSRHIRGLGFLSLALIGVESQKACPVLMEQLPADLNRKTKKSSPKLHASQKRGRPKGSKNKNKQSVELTDYLKWVRLHLEAVLNLLNQVSVVYFVYDGAFGNYPSCAMVKSCGLSLISKLQCNSALWFPNQAPYSGRGAPKKYGEKVQYSEIPQTARKQKVLESGVEETIYQIQAWHKSFPFPINCVILQRKQIKNGKVSQVILFSDDLHLNWENMILYYRLRFQIEFTFRDAKQFWGLEDFMNIKENSVKNAANLAMFMVNLSRILIEKEQPLAKSIHDLKATAKAQFFWKQIFKIYPEIEKVISFSQHKERFDSTGSIHQSLQAA